MKGGTAVTSFANQKKLCAILMVLLYSEYQSFSPSEQHNCALWIHRSETCSYTKVALAEEATSLQNWAHTL